MSSRERAPVARAVGRSSCPSIAPAGESVALGLVAGLRAFSRSRRELVGVGTALLLLAPTAAIVGIQLNYAAGGGGAYRRCLIPLAVVTSHIAPPKPSGGDLATAPVFQSAAWVATGIAGVACVAGVVTVLLVAVVRSR